MAGEVNEKVKITELDAAQSLDGLFVVASKAGNSYKVPVSQIKGVPHVTMTEADYEALSVKDPNTIYLLYEEE